jgi:hypothetical protein
LETPFFRTGRKRGSPGVAIAVRAMEKFAVLGVDSLGIAHSQRAAATDRKTSNVVPDRLACWHLGSHHVAGLEASNGVRADARAARQTVCRQLGQVVPSSACLDCERRLLPADERHTMALYEALADTGLPVEASSAGRIKHRARLGIPKTHALDGACVGEIVALRAAAALSGALACALMRSSRAGCRQVHTRATKLLTRFDPRPRHIGDAAIGTVPCEFLENVFPDFVVSKLKQAENLFVAILAGDDGNAGGPAARVKLHSDRLTIAPDAVLRADRERIAAIDNRPVAFEKPTTLFGARHDRPLVLIEEEYRQF